MHSNKIEDREIIIEYHSFGQIVKVSAMDAQTLTEISVQGPAAAGETQLKRHALRRLEYVMKKKGLI